MALNLDFSEDLITVIDLVESVTYQSRNGTQYQGVPVAKALRGQPSRKERAPTGGVYTGFDLLWLIPGALLDPVEPKPGDRVVEADGTTTRTVLSYDYDQLDRVWQCYTVRLDLALDLRDLVTVYGPSGAASNKDAAGGYTPTFTAVYSGVASKLQQTDGQAAEERGRRGTLGKYTLWVLDPTLTLRTDYYVQDASGQKYDITGWGLPGSIAEAWPIYLELRP